MKALNKSGSVLPSYRKCARRMSLNNYVITVYIVPTLRRIPMCHCFI